MSQTYFDKIRTLFTERVPHCRAMGMEAVRVENGVVELRMPYQAYFLGSPQRGWIHGGVLSTLIDTASGMAACTVIDESERIVTLDLRIDYLRPAKERQVLSARAECYRLARSIAFIKAEVWQQRADQPVATGLATFARLRDPSADQGATLPQSGVE